MNVPQAEGMSHGCATALILIICVVGGTLLALMTMLVTGRADVKLLSLPLDALAIGTMILVRRSHGRERKGERHG